jgi:membrane fusion protein, multidrug efflux system
MPTDQPTAGNDSPATITPETTPSADGRTVVAPGDRVPQTAKAAPNGGFHLVKWLLYGGIACVVLLGGLVFGVPWLIEAFTTESTDDAYVNGHVTFVAARVPGQVIKVRVDDNNRVRKGDLLVQLDPEPYQIQVDLKTAALTQARADLVAAQDQVRGQIALARSNRFKLKHTIENVNTQIAQLEANVADLETTKARQVRAKADYKRAKELEKTPGAISPQDVDLRLQDLRVTEAQVKQAREMVYQTRVGLGLPAQPERRGSDGRAHLETERDNPGPSAQSEMDNDLPLDAVPLIGAARRLVAANLDPDRNLTEVPPDLDQTFSTVRQSVAELLQSAAPLGVFPSSYDLTPKQLLEEFYRRDPQGNFDNITAQILKDAPAIKQAEAKLAEAEQDLKQAALNLRYCNVYAEIDGVVTRRNVNRGNNVQAGQSLLAIRSLTEIWIDANFKETQLRQLRIGQHVRLEVDMYGSHHTFQGHITGFTMGTGSTLAVLPPENATGNFVKVVQRLPVRIELDDYNPDRDPPLFIGLSVEPYVYIKRPATGENAGQVLQPYFPTKPDERDPEVDTADKRKDGKR